MRASGVVTSPCGHARASVYMYERAFTPRCVVDERVIRRVKKREKQATMQKIDQFQRRIYQNIFDCLETNELMRWVISCKKLYNWNPNLSIEPSEVFSNCKSTLHC